MSPEEPLVGVSTSIQIITSEDNRRPANDTAATAAKRWIKDQGSRCVSSKNLKRRFPIVKWAPKYNLDCLLGDVIAGLTVGLTVIPQGMAYANLAGLTVEYGLYSAFMGCFMYVIFGTVPAITIGPTAIVSIMTEQYTSGPETAILLAFLTGCIQFVLGICNLGFIIDFISAPVVSGFVTAAAVSIATSQLGAFFGISVDGHTTFEEWIDFFKNIKDIQLWDTVMAVISFIFLICLKEFKEVKWGNQNEEEQGTAEKVAKKTVWLSCTARNAIIVVISTIIGYYTFSTGALALTGEVDGGMPGFQLPPFSPTINGTEYSFIQMCQELSTGIIILPLIAILENMAIAKAFSKGIAVDASQEMLALGVANIMGSFVKSYPVTGSFSRTAVNSASGVKTTAGGIITGSLVLLALGVLTTTFQYIPDSCLAAVIIASVIYTAEFGHLVHIWKTKKIDLLPWIVTFILCLALNLEWGIIGGICLSIVMLMYPSARPSIKIQTIQGRSDVIIICPKGGLYFPSVEFVRQQTNKKGLQNPGKTIILDCSFVQGADFTTAEGFQSMASDFRRREQRIVFVNIKPSVLRVIEGLHIEDLVHYQNMNQIPENFNKEGDESVAPRNRKVELEETSGEASVPFLPDQETINV